MTPSCTISNRCASSKVDDWLQLWNVWETNLLKFFPGVSLEIWKEFEFMDFQAQAPIVLNSVEHIGGRDVSFDTARIWSFWSSFFGDIVCNITATYSIDCCLFRVIHNTA